MKAYLGISRGRLCGHEDCSIMGRPRGTAGLPTGFISRERPVRAQKRLLTMSFLSTQPLP